MDKSENSSRSLVNVRRRLLSVATVLLLASTACSGTSTGRRLEENADARVMARSMLIKEAAASLG
jgi:hypothetical protein